MFRDADSSDISTTYVICGYTDIGYDIDSLATIIGKRFNILLFVPDKFFLFCGKYDNKIKGLL